MARRIDSTAALANKALAGSSWARAHQRLTGDVEPIITPSFKIESGARVFTIGSCFARNIEERLAEADFDLPMMRFSVPPAEYPSHPRGILNKYTPAAIWQEVSWAARIVERGGGVSDADIAPFRHLCDNGSIIDTNLGGFIGVSPERFAARRAEVYETFAELFTSDYVILTLGLIEAWFDVSADLYVQQAPIGRRFRDETRFKFEVLSYAACLKFITDSIDLIHRLNPQARMLLTASPVPLGRTFTADDVLIANMHSKSVLRAVCGEVRDAYDFVDYFPSYESAMATRSWDIWKDDKRHVTEPFVGRMIDQLAKNYFTT